jgi:hypothetical protein
MLQIVEGILCQTALMFQAFCADNPDSVTEEEVHEPEISNSQSLIVKSHHIDCLDIHKIATLDDVDGLWTVWKNSNETFEDFMERIQQWSKPPSRDTVYLADPVQPKFAFAQFVSNIMHQSVIITF